MHYAPNVSNEDVGGAADSRTTHYFSEHVAWQASPDPFAHTSGATDYFVQFGGVTERAATQGI